MRTPIRTSGTLVPTWHTWDPAPCDPLVCGCWGEVSPLATAWTWAQEDAVLTVTCKWCGMVGVGKVMSAAGSDREEEDSDSSLQIKLSCVTRAATSSSLLGVLRCLRA